MKIHQVEIHNLKAIRYLSIDLEGKHVLITADNGVGKTSFLQAIYAGLGIKSMAPPVTEGEKTGSVHLWSDEGYEFETTVDSIKGVTKVSVKLPDERLWDTKVSAVGAVVGDLLFNPFEFAELSKTEAGKKKQIEIVKALLTDEERVTLAQMERQIKANEENRTETGRYLKTMKGAVDAKGITQETVQKYQAPINVDEISAEKNRIVAANNHINDVRSRFNERAEKIAALELELAGLKEKQIQAESFLAENKITDIKDLDAKISEASTHNTMVDKVKDYLQQISKMKELESQYGEESSLIDTQRELYRRTIRELELPLPDLTFDEEQIIYQGRAVDNNVMSTSEIMGLGIMMKVAKNPGVRVMVVERAESLGTKKLNELIDTCDMYGFQILAEQVVRGQEELKIEYLTKLPQ